MATDETVRFGVRLPENLLAEIQVEATARDMSANKLITLLLAKGLEALAEVPAR